MLVIGPSQEKVWSESPKLELRFSACEPVAHALSKTVKTSMVKSLSLFIIKGVL